MTGPALGPRRLVAAVALAAVALSLCACRTDSGTTATSPATVAETSAGTEGTSTVTTSQEAGDGGGKTAPGGDTTRAAVTPAVPRPSATSLAYARNLGGVSHKGETLWFIVGASVDTEAEAQRELATALPRFGDMQSYLIVQRSDNFRGFRAGWWTVIEAYRQEPSAESLSFAKRGFPDAYVKQATVLTSDPIPVYEDIVGTPL